MSESLGAFTKVSNLCFILGFFFVYLYFMLFKYSPWVRPFRGCWNRKPFVKFATWILNLSVELLCQALSLNYTSHLLVVGCSLLSETSKRLLTSLKTTCCSFGWYKTPVNFFFKEKNNCRKWGSSFEGRVWRNALCSQCLLSKLTSPRGCEDPFRAQSPAGEQTDAGWWGSGSACCVLSAPGDYSVMMWEIEIATFKVYISQSAYV